MSNHILPFSSFSKFTNVKLARYETVSENILQRGTENTHSLAVHAFLDVDTGEINPLNQIKSEMCSRTVPGRIDAEDQLLAKIPTNQRGDERVTL